MKKIFFTLVLLVSVAYAQKMKYAIADCTIQQGVNSKKDTVFNGTGGNIFCLVDLTAKTIDFDWQLKDYKTIKHYSITESQVIKQDIYKTMGIYNMKFKCLNKNKDQCSIEITVSERINKIQILVVDGTFVLAYNAVEVKLTP